MKLKGHKTTKIEKASDGWRWGCECGQQGWYCKTKNEALADRAEHLEFIHEDDGEPSCVIDEEGAWERLNEVQAERNWGGQ